MAFSILEQNFKHDSKCFTFSESLLKRLIASHAAFVKSVSASRDFGNEQRALCKASI